MSALRNTVLGATLALGTAFSSIATPANAEQDSASNMALATTNTNAKDFTAANNQYVHNFPTLTQSEAETKSLNGVVLHIGNNFSFLLADTLKDELIDLGYDAQVALGGPQDELRLMINGKSGKVLFNFENAFTYLVETVQQVVPQTRKPSQNNQPATSLN